MTAPDSRRSRSTSPLWQRIRTDAMRTVAVMGMTKNTGKTVALNHLLAQAATDGVAVGLTSIGRDGEERDAVFSIPKPPVKVWPGTVVATARDTLQRAGLRYRLLGTTGVDSPMGEIVFVRALEGGTMEVAGASRSRGQLEVIAMLRECAASVVFLDGALGRSQHASPAIADGVVLATGAAIGGAIPDVIRKTRERLAVLTIPAADAPTRALCGEVLESGGVALWGPRGECLFRADIASLNAGATLLEQARQPIATLACAGAVGRGLWQAIEALATQHPGLTVVVADGTRLFVDASALAALTRRGARVVAHRPIRIAGITLNPCSALGAHFAAADLLAAARSAFADHEVTDVLWDSRTAQEPEHRDGSIAA